MALGNYKRRVWLCLTSSRESLRHQKVLILGHVLEILSHLWDMCPPEADASPLTIAPSGW